MTEQLFRDDAYLKTCDARVLGVNERGGIVLDRTIFYATGGGQPGDTGTLEIDGTGQVERRYRHMRMHTCMHLLCAVLPYPVTGGQVGAESSRLDFDIEDAGAVDKDELTEKLNRLIEADHAVTQRWITDEELLANQDLVRTMSVKPPMGSGRVRLVAIGDGEIDLQPCGGTHVRSTGEIGKVAVQKIEKKGRLNRRVRIAFAE
jgi:misacylated tRNA(Ala) deacylase